MSKVNIFNAFNTETSYCVGYDRGPRDYQEDAYGGISGKNKVLFVVADGMGGHSRGDMASNIVVSSFLDVFKENFLGDGSLSERDVLLESLEKAYSNILAKNMDMGSTLVAVLMVKQDKDNYLLYYTWVGDSRIYLFSEIECKNPSVENDAIGISYEKENTEEIFDKPHQLWLLTRDDSLVFSFFPNDMSIDQITQHPAKNQLQHSIHPSRKNFPKRVGVARVKKGDYVLLCTDGVWESFEYQTELLECFRGEKKGTSGKTEEICRKITNSIKNGINSGLCDDNNTFILFRVGDEVLKKEGSFSSSKPPEKRKDKKNPMVIKGLILFIFFVLCVGIFIFLNSGSENSFWEEVKRENTISAYKIYLNKYPEGLYAQVARTKIKELERKRKEEEKRKALEAEKSLWEDVKGENTISAYESYLNKYPDGIYIQIARNKIKGLEEEKKREEEKSFWEEVKRRNVISGYKAYLNEYPDGIYAKVAREKIKRLGNDQVARKRERKLKKEKSFWQKVEQKNTISAYENYLKKYPEGLYAKIARNKIKELEKKEEKRRALKAEDSLWEKVKRKNTIEGYKKYLKKYPKGTYAQNAKKSIKELEKEKQKARKRRALEAEDSLWKKVKRKNTIESYEKYLNKYPHGRYAKSAKGKIIEIVKNSYKSLPLFPQKQKKDFLGKKIDELKKIYKNSKDKNIKNKCMNLIIKIYNFALEKAKEECEDKKSINKFFGFYKFGEGGDWRKLNISKNFKDKLKKIKDRAEKELKPIIIKKVKIGDYKWLILSKLTEKYRNKPYVFLAVNGCQKCNFSSYFSEIKIVKNKNSIADIPKNLEKCYLVLNVSFLPSGKLFDICCKKNRNSKISLFITVRNGLKIIKKRKFLGRGIEEKYFLKGGCISIGS